MSKDLIAKATTSVDAPRDAVWKALVSPEAISQYMFGTTVVTDWRRGSPITWKGEWKGKPYEDKGVILQIDPEQVLEYSHFSPLSGQPDVPENHHVVRITLSEANGRTDVTLTQNGNATEEEQQHSAANWAQMLDGLKKFVEGERSGKR